MLWSNRNLCNLYKVNQNIFHAQVSFQNMHIILIKCKAFLFTLCDLAEDVIRERTGFHSLLSGAPKAGRHSSAMSYELQNHMVIHSTKTS